MGKKCFAPMELFGEKLNFSTDVSLLRSKINILINVQPLCGCRCTLFVFPRFRKLHQGLLTFNPLRGCRCTFIHLHPVAQATTRAIDVQPTSGLSVYFYSLSPRFRKLHRGLFKFNHSAVLLG